MKFRMMTFAVMFAAMCTLGGCGESDTPAAPTGTAPGEGAAPAEGGKIVLYCGRSTSLVKPVLEKFTAATGIEVDLKDGKTGDLAALLMTEGDKTPADVFWAQDPAALGQLASDGLLAKLPDAVLSKVPSKFTSPDGKWVATSGRARVLAFAPKRVSGDALPASVFDLTDSKWKGRVGWAPTNGSFQAFLTAMRAVHGDEKAMAWVEGMKANDAKVYPKNTPIIEALAAGEIDLGIPNHYYLLRYKKSEGADYPVEQTFFKDGDIGNLIMVAGVGVTASSKNAAAAQKFVEYLLSEEAQRYFTNEVFEYPVAAGVESHELLVDQDKLVDTVPDVKVEQMSDLDGTKKLLQEAGLF